MAVIEQTVCEWTPSQHVIAKRLDVREEDRLSFDEAYRIAMETFVPCVHACEVQIEAIGDHFALLSGIWVEEERLVQTLRSALRIWIFAVTGVETRYEIAWLSSLSELAARDCVAQWLLSIPKSQGERTEVIYREPSPEWTDALSLQNVKADHLCGVALTMPGNGCVGCRQAGCQCSACSATKTNV